MANPRSLIIDCDTSLRGPVSTGRMEAFGVVDGVWTPQNWPRIGQEGLGSNSDVPLDLFEPLARLRAMRFGVALFRRRRKSGGPTRI